MQESPERAALRRIVQLRQDFGFVIGDVLIVEQPFESGESGRHVRIVQSDHAWLPAVLEDFLDALERFLMRRGRFAG